MRNTTRATSLLSFPEIDVCSATDKKPKEINSLYIFGRSAYNELPVKFGE